MKRADITIEKILTDYQRAMDLARANEKTGDMIMAAKEQARLVGLLVERKEVGNAGEFEQMTDAQDVLDKVAREIGPEAANALAIACGYAEQSEGEADNPAQIEGPTPEDSIN